MVLRMIISEKWIHINSYDVCFDYNVKSVIILKQKIIVQLEIGDLYAVDMAGNIIEKNNKPFQRSDLDKDFIVEINQNNLYFNNSAIYFEHNIYSFVLFDDRIIVQLNELDASAKYNVPLVKTQMKKIIVTAKTLYSHPKNVSKIYAALHTDLAW